MKVVMTEARQTRIKNIKLSSGQEIIADIVSYDEGMLMVSKPIQVVYRYFQNTGVPMISFNKYMLLSVETNYVFNVKDILNISQPHDVVVDYYNLVVDNIYAHCDSLICEELVKSMSDIENEENKSKMYDYVLQNFESDVKN